MGARCRRRATGSATSRRGPVRWSPTSKRPSTRSSWRRRSKNFKLPPDIALMPYDTFYRAGDHQLMPTLYVGNAVEKGSDPEDLFKVDELVKAIDAALPVSETGCHLSWPV